MSATISSLIPRGQIMNQKGFSILPLVAIAALLVVLGGGYWVVKKQPAATVSDVNRLPVLNTDTSAQISAATTNTENAKVADAAITITAPATGATLSGVKKTTVKWDIPTDFLRSFPTDFNVYVFLYVESQEDKGSMVGIGDGNPASLGSVVWDIPAYVSAGQLKPGTHKIVANMSAEPKDAQRFCAVTEGKDCAPTAADKEIMLRASRVKTETGWFTIAPTPDSATVSVAGMSKYTDTDFGFSFWYPSGWTVTNVSGTGPGLFAGTTDRAGNLSAGRIMIRGGGIEINIDKVSASDLTYRVNAGACGYCGPLNYFFDPSLHQWMKVYPDGPNGAPGATPEQIAQYKLPRPADVSKNTMGGLHMFSTEQRESAVIIPLSARNFIQVTGVTYSQQCGGYCASEEKGAAEFLARTIVATDPSVATPAGRSEQQAVIQAEKDAYAN